MYKKLLVLSIATTMSLSASVVQASDGVSLRICEYVSVNDKKRLRSFLKDNKLKIRNIFDDMQCNGQNLLIFAASSNALDVGELIIGKLPAKKVEENLAAVTGHSAHLAEIAKKRID